VEIFDPSFLSSRTRSVDILSPTWQALPRNTFVIWLPGEAFFHLICHFHGSSNLFSSPSSVHTKPIQTATAPLTLPVVSASVSSPLSSPQTACWQPELDSLNIKVRCFLPACLLLSNFQRWKREPCTVILTSFASTPTFLTSAT
jgi:hypothetical protein